MDDFIVDASDISVGSSVSTTTHASTIIDVDVGMAPQPTHASPAMLMSGTEVFSVSSLSESSHDDDDKPEAKQRKLADDLVVPHAVSDTEQKHPHHKRRVRQSTNAARKILKAQQRSHINGAMLLRTLKAGMQQIALNYVPEGEHRKMFSKHAYLSLNNLLLAEMRSILRSAHNNVAKTRRKTLLGRDVILSTLEYLNPNEDTWSTGFVELRNQVLNDGIEVSSKSIKMFCAILQYYI